MWSDELQEALHELENFVDGAICLERIYQPAYTHKFVFVVCGISYVYDIQTGKFEIK